MKEITYYNIVDTLLGTFPEYAHSKEYDEKDKEFQYAIMGGFGRFLTQSIEDETPNIELIERAFKFINQIYNGIQVSNQDGTDTLQNLLYIEIFENLAQTKSGTESARKYLEAKAKDEFEKVFSFTGIENISP